MDSRIRELMVHLDMASFPSPTGTYPKGRIIEVASSSSRAQWKSLLSIESTSDDIVIM